MIKTFRSSDKKGTDGIDFGDEWYKRMIRDDAPWIYELAMEVYRAAKSGNMSQIEREMKRLQRFTDFTMRGPFMEEFRLAGKESHMFLMEFPRMLQRTLAQLKEKKSHTRRKSSRTPATQ